jgi:hypothetical protein
MQAAYATHQALVLAASAMQVRAALFPLENELGIASF